MLLTKDSLLLSCNQVEELVAGSNTGKAPQLGDFYNFWEMAVFNALVLMVIKGLEKLNTLLTKKPLFKVCRCAVCKKSTTQ